MTTEATVEEMLVDFVEGEYCWHRIVRLEDGRFAYVWGETPADPGDTLDPQRIADPTADVGIEVRDTWEAIAKAWNDTASCWDDDDDRPDLAAAMRAAIGTVEAQP